MNYLKRIYFIAFQDRVLDRHESNVTLIPIKRSIASAAEPSVLADRFLDEENNRDIGSSVCEYSPEGNVGNEFSCRPTCLRVLVWHELDYLPIFRNLPVGLIQLANSNVATNFQHLLST